MKEADDKKNKKKLPTQMMLMIRGFISVYLLYLAVDILRTENQSNLRAFEIGAAGLFILGGAIVLALTVRSFVKGEYEGGKADYEDEEQND